jgi:hypothetical protein
LAGILKAGEAQAAKKKIAHGAPPTPPAGGPG